MTLTQIDPAFYLKPQAASRAVALMPNEQLLLAREGGMEVYYSPFDHVAVDAKLVVVGITPGQFQAQRALELAVRQLRAGSSLEEALRVAKLGASFSGTGMRNNLVTMLDAIGAARPLGVAACAELFRPGTERVHFTSALRYPVFVDGKNYNGSPDMLKTPMLRRMIDNYLADEARLLPDAIWLPLGPKAEAAVLHLAGKGLLDPKRVLAGMPHPSGANAERVAIFTGKKPAARASSRTKAATLLEAFDRLTVQIAGVAA